MHTSGNSNMFKDPVQLLRPQQLKLINKPGQDGALDTSISGVVLAVETKLW